MSMADPKPKLGRATDLAESVKRGLLLEKAKRAAVENYEQRIAPDSVRVQLPAQSDLPATFPVLPDT